MNSCRNMTIEDELMTDPVAFFIQWGRFCLRTRRTARLCPSSIHPACFPCRSRIRRKIGIMTTRLAISSDRLLHSLNWRRSTCSRRKLTDTYISGIPSSRLWHPLAIKCVKCEKFSLLLDTDNLGRLLTGWRRRIYCVNLALAAPKRLPPFANSLFRGHDPLWLWWR